MKEFLKEYTKMIISILCTVLFALGFYNIYINLLHQNYIDQSVLVSNLDKNYSSYHDNIETIEYNLKEYDYDSAKYPYDMQTMEKLRGRLNVCLTTMKKETGLYSVQVNEQIRPERLYKINNNFINELVNQCWVSAMGYINLEEHDYKGYFKDVFPVYNKVVGQLVNNTNYVKDELLNNSSYHYSTSITRDTVHNEYLSQYNTVINNYKTFSDIILEVSEFLIKGEI